MPWLHYLPREATDHPMKLSNTTRGHEGRKMTSRIAPAVLAAFLAIAGCGEITSNLPETTRLRIVNAVINLNTTTTPGNSIDFYFDSTTSGAGVAGLQLHGVRDYVEVPIGLHTYFAELSSGPAPKTNLFRTVLRQYFTPAPGITAVIVGVNPAAGIPVAGAITAAVVNDDLFTPRTVNGVLQTRIRIINAAPYSVATGLGTLVNLYISPGSVPLTTIAGTAPQLTNISYRAPSSYLNLGAGEYVVTIATTAGIVLRSDPVRLTAGNVRTFILVNTGPVAGSAIPGPANHGVLTLIDADF